MSNEEFDYQDQAEGNRTENGGSHEAGHSTTLPAIVEAMIFASPEPVSAEDICKALLMEDETLEIEPTEIAGIIYKLNGEYASTGRSFSIVARGRGYTFMTSERFHPWLQFIQHENITRKISQSAVETLAIIAYRQPVTKPEIEQIRGVDSGYILRNLLEKKLIIVAGRRDSPGKPLLYKTSETFLMHFGINSVDELPKPREIEEILKDDDMSEHRQLLLELKTELNPDSQGQGKSGTTTQPQEAFDINEIVGRLKDRLGAGSSENQPQAEADSDTSDPEKTSEQSASDSSINMPEDGSQPDGGSQTDGDRDETDGDTDTDPDGPSGRP